MEYDWSIVNKEQVRNIYDFISEAGLQPCSQLSTFSRKNEITIPGLRYRKAKELTVRLNGLVKTILT